MTLKKAHSDKNLADIEKYTEELNTVWQEASQDIYQAQQEAGGAPNAENGSQESNPNPNEDGDVQDADFEEVK